ncbi:ABC transporter ATP-binding protein [Mesorhizobium australicum]|nr:ABC transporter ATP-binding protein [Mesorhizobium australicum]
MLEIKGVQAGYGDFSVLHGIDLFVGQGEAVAVLGANGVGKTTLNRVISGLVPARAGEVWFEGRNITNWDHADIVSLGLVHVPEGRRIFPNLTVLDNLLLGSYRRGRAQRALTLEKVFATFPRLDERQRQAAGSLSGGEQQMLAIGRGMMSDPRLLILDEPSLGLSPKLTDELFELIGRLMETGLSILLVEQNVYRSVSIAQRAYVVERGLIALSGSSEDLLDSSELKKAYLGF